MSRPIRRRYARRFLGTALLAALVTAGTTVTGVSASGAHAEETTSITIDSHDDGDRLPVGQVRLAGHYTAGYEPMVHVNGVRWERAHADDPDGDDTGTWWYDLDTTTLDGELEVAVRINDIKTRYSVWSPFLLLTVDNKPANVPSVTIDGPTDRAAVRGRVPVVLSAHGRNRLVAVEVRMNGGRWREARHRAGDRYVFDWNSREVGDAMASIEARARDVHGNVGRSLTTYVQVGAGRPEPVRGGHIDRSMWLWEGAAYNLVHNTGSRRQLDAFVNDTTTFGSRPVRTIYFSTGRFGGEDMLEELRPRVRDLVAWAHAEGVQIYALIVSDATPSFMGGIARYHDTAVREYEKVLNYNLSSAPHERFNGVNIDIEPYAHPDFAAKEPLLQLQWLDILERMKSRRDAAGSGMQFGPAMPFWLDGITVTWHGQQKTMAQHMQDINDYVTLMDYRDRGEMIIDAAKEEIAYAEEIGKKHSVVLGVETGDTALGGDPELITFREEGRTWMERELGTVYAHYGADSAFAGIAMHYYDSLLELPSAWGAHEVRPPVPTDHERPTGVSTPPVATMWDFSEIDLHWGRAHDDGEVSHYNVYRSTDPEFAPGPVTLAGAARDLTFADAGLLADTRYYYRVGAVDMAGNEGPVSGVTSARTGSTDLRPMVLDDVRVTVADGTATAAVRVVDKATGLGVPATVRGRFTKLGGAYVTMPTADADGRTEAPSELLDLPGGTVGFLPHRIIADGYYWAGAYDRVHSAEVEF